MKCLYFSGVAAAALAVSVAGSAEPAHSLAEDAAAFGNREAAYSVDISPSGKELVMLVPGPGRVTGLRVIDLATAHATDIFRSDGNPESIQWCQFASDTQIVCQFGGNIASNAAPVIGFSRLIMISTDGKTVKPLGNRQTDSGERFRQTDGEIIDWMPNQPGSVLLTHFYVPDEQVTENTNRDTRSGLGVDKLDLATFRSRPVESPREDVGGYQTDGRGTIRLLEAEDHDGAGQMTGAVHFRYTLPGSGDWQPLGDYDLRTNEGVYPLAVDATLNAAYVLKKVDGRDALYTIKLDGSRAMTPVAANNRVDIDDVVRIGRGQRVIGYTYAEDRQQVIYFDPEFSKLAGALGNALPGHPSINFEGASADGSRLLVFATSDTMPGRYYVFDKAAKHLDEAASVRPVLDGRTLAAVTTVSVPAADNVQIPAYLTLPTSGVTKNLPAIVLPHGGPADRDKWGFDWIAQFLAARGYAVIQPNYRGSSGYGDQWEGKNGFKDWKTAISDITAAAHYLVTKGIADPNRLAIVGWSYGGYAALQSAAVEPNLYKAAVAIAPVTDLSMLKSESRNFTNNKLVEDYLGSGENMAEGSPLRRADQIKVPVLMFHGDLDSNVGIAESRKMAAALTHAGDKAELVQFAGLDHQLRDSAVRTQMLTRIGQFLDASIGH